MDDARKDAKLLSPKRLLQAIMKGFQGYRPVNQISRDILKAWEQEQDIYCRALARSMPVGFAIVCKDTPEPKSFQSLASLFDHHLERLYCLDPMLEAASKHGCLVSCEHDGCDIFSTSEPVKADVFRAVSCIVADREALRESDCGAC